MEAIPTFSQAEQVLFVGSSAGGFGALLNGGYAATRFAPIPLTVVSDSSPPMASNVMAPCLQEHWRTLWNFDDTVLDPCGEQCATYDDYTSDFVQYLVDGFPDLSLGLISSAEDAGFRTFLTAGAGECHILDPARTDDDVLAFIYDPVNMVTAEAYRAGLLDIRERRVNQGAALGTFYIDSDVHIWLKSDVTFNQEVEGITLGGWLQDLLLERQSV